MYWLTNLSLTSGKKARVQRLYNAFAGQNVTEPARIRKQRPKPQLLTLPLPAGVGGRQRPGPKIAAVCPGRGRNVQTANYDNVTQVPRRQL